jgi:hypothetical protein
MSIRASKVGSNILIIIEEGVSTFSKTFFLNQMNTTRNNINQIETKHKLKRENHIKNIFLLQMIHLLHLQTTAIQLVIFI